MGNLKKILAAIDAYFLQHENKKHFSEDLGAVKNITINPFFKGNNNILVKMV